MSRFERDPPLLEWGLPLLEWGLPLFETGVNFRETGPHSYQEWDLPFLSLRFWESPILLPLPLLDVQPFAKWSQFVLCPPEVRPQAGEYALTAEEHIYVDKCLQEADLLMQAKVKCLELDIEFPDELEQYLEDLEMGVKNGIVIGLKWE
jgi:hypothetical protein